MKYKATISFAGNLSMTVGEVRELPATSPVVKDLLDAGYIVPTRAKRGAKNDPDNQG